jgi:hypothetical protein
MSDDLATTFLSDSFYRSPVSSDIYNMYMHVAGEEFRPRQPANSITLEAPMLHNLNLFQK